MGVEERKTEELLKFGESIRKRYFSLRDIGITHYQTITALQQTLTEQFAALPLDYVTVCPECEGTGRVFDNGDCWPCGCDNGRINVETFK